MLSCRSRLPWPCSAVRCWGSESCAAASGRKDTRSRGSAAPEAADLLRLRHCLRMPPSTVIKRKTANIDIRVERQLIDRIDAWRDQQRVRPSRSAAIVHMIEDFLERESIT